MSESNPISIPKVDGPSRPQGLVPHVPGGEAGSPDVTVLLNLPETPNSDRLGWLSRVLGFELYSSALLTRKVKVELQVMAGVLCAVFLFELLAWSFFFNGMFSGQMTDLGPATIAAVVLGLLFASAILYFERQVVAADSHGLKRPRRLAAAWVRVVFILVAGYVVAHAVDLLVFRIPVANALHQEAVAGESARLQEDLEFLTRNRGAALFSTTKTELAHIRGRLKDTRARRVVLIADEERAREGSRALQQDVKKARLSVERGENALESLSPESDPTAARQALEDARRHLRALLEPLSSSQGELGASESSLGVIEEQLTTLMKQEGLLESQRLQYLQAQEQAQQLWDKLDQRRRAWIAELRRAGPGDRVEDASDWLERMTDEEKALVPVTWLEPLEFEKPSHSFFEQLKALYEVVFQAPAGSRWKDPYFTSWLGIHLAAIFIPFVVLVSKWILMPKEVDAYFSTAHQAHAGDPDARLMVKVEEDVLGSDRE